MKKFTDGAKRKIVREWLDGADKQEVMEKYKCSAQQLAGWRRYYGDEVEAPAEAKIERKERIPLNAQEKLTFTNPDPNYVYRGVVEDDRRMGRVEQFKAAGWEPVPKSEGRFGIESVDHPDQPGSTIARASGMGSTTYLMRKRKDWEEEDFQKIETQHSEKEEAIFGELKKTGRYGRISVGGRTEER